MRLRLGQELGIDSWDHQLVGTAPQGLWVGQMQGIRPQKITQPVCEKPFASGAVWV